MTQNKLFGISLNNRKSKIILLLSLPGFLLTLSLLLLCIKPLSIYVSKCYPELIALSLLCVKGKVDFPQIGFEKGTTERGVSKVSKSC